MNEIVLREQQTALADQIEYAKTVSVAAMLPDAYRGKPADIMLAVGLGSSMGLSPAESLYRIHVIKGKPTASAELIAANVRKAGHRLRVRGDETSCTASIIRADDPDFEFSVTRDAAWAQRMGLAGEPNYKKQPGTMLQWRAITAVARLACPEALYGVAYTSDEITEDRGTSEPTQRVTAAEVLGEQPAAEPETVDAEVVDLGNAPEMITGQQTKLLGVLMKQADLTERPAALAYASRVVGRDIGSRNELTKDEASAVIDALKADIANLSAAGADEPEPGLDPTEESQ